MTVNLAAVDQFIDKLDQKARYYIVNKILPGLAVWQLDKIAESAERLAENISSQKESSFLYDIREVNNNYYAYIKRIGKEYPNIYIGVMRFRQGRTYRITHKHKPIEKIVRGLGLEQKGVKTYLNIEFISPEAEICSYLFYDPNLNIPRSPQQWDIENEESLDEDGQVVLSTLEQNISRGRRKANTYREDWSAIFVKKDWVVEEITEENKNNLQPKQTLNTAKASEPDSRNEKDITLPLPNKKQIPISRPPENLYKKKLIQPKQELVLIRVEKTSSQQVERYLQQWANLIGLLPNNPKWKLVIESNLYKLIDQSSNRVIVEYERTSQRLSARSVRVLHSLLFEAMSNVANSKLVTREQKSLAQRWLLQLQKPPLDDEQELLAFIFNL